MGKVLQDYFHSEAAEVFPQDRYSIYLYIFLIINQFLIIYGQHKKERFLKKNTYIKLYTILFTRDNCMGLSFQNFP